MPPFHAESIPKFVSHDREIAQHETNSNKFSPEKMLCTPLNLKSPTTMAQNVITSEVHFHARNKLHKIEKPYCLRYEPGPEVARTNIEIEKNSIAIHDIRGLEDTLSLDSCGITILALKSELSYEDFALEEQVRRVYISEVTGALKELFGASHIHVFDSLIRRRHQSFPLSTGEEYQFNQPTNLVHIDATQLQSQNVSDQIHEARGLSKKYRRVQSVNIWKPLKGPLSDWPLVLCDPRTLCASSDLIPTDQVFVDQVVENCGIYYSAAQKWYYLSNQMPSELLVFVQSDSREGSVPGVPHCSFFNPTSPIGAILRESIELRAIVCYE